MRVGLLVTGDSALAGSKLLTDGSLSSRAAELLLVVRDAAGVSPVGGVPCCCCTLLGSCTCTMRLTIFLTTFFLVPVGAGVLLVAPAGSLLGCDPDGPGAAAGAAGAGEDCSANIRCISCCLLRFCSASASASCPGGGADDDAAGLSSAAHVTMIIKLGPMLH